MKKKVLIIEDDKDTSELIGYLAEELNFDIAYSSRILTSAEIVSIAPDLILLDHWVADGRGGELCLELKSDALTKHIKVIMISAHLDIKHIAKESCADSYIEKPFDIDVLLKDIAEVSG